MLFALDFQFVLFSYFVLTHYAGLLENENVLSSLSLLLLLNEMTASKLLDSERVARTTFGWFEKYYYGRYS